MWYTIFKLIFASAFIVDLNLLLITAPGKSNLVLFDCFIFLKLFNCFIISNGIFLFYSSWTEKRL